MVFAEVKNLDIAMSQNRKYFTQNFEAYNASTGNSRGETLQCYRAYFGRPSSFITVHEHDRQTDERTLISYRAESSTLKQCLRFTIIILVIQVG